MRCAQAALGRAATWWCATGTASGKSLGYLLPVLAPAMDGRGPDGRGATALYLAPTKALAADQAAPG